MERSNKSDLAIAYCGTCGKVRKCNGKLADKDNGSYLGPLSRESEDDWLPVCQTCSLCYGYPTFRGPLKWWMQLSFFHVYTDAFMHFVDEDEQHFLKHYTKDPSGLPAWVVIQEAEAIFKLLPAPPVRWNDGRIS